MDEKKRNVVGSHWQKMKRALLSILYFHQNWAGKEIMIFNEISPA